MKICLITPPSPFLLDERVFMSLGILKVGAVLERSGYEVDHLDLSGVTNYQDVVQEYMGAEILAITSTTPQMPAATKIAQIARERGLKTIIGGPHPTLTLAAKKQKAHRADRALEQLISTFDVIVAGDGEKAIFQALQMKSGIVDADDPKTVFWMTSPDFAESPWPARHLVDVESYKYSVDGMRALSIISQLGCPFKCSFCAGRDSPMLRRIRLRPPENVIGELVYLNKTYGITGCMFLDDELNVNKQMLELMKGLKETGIEWRLRGFLKAELFTDEQAHAMFEAGFRQLLIGFESGHPRILENIQKNATVEDNTRAMEIATRHGLKVKALMSVGHPGESTETIDATREWLLKVKPSDFDVTIITPYPGSPYYDRSVLEDGCYVYQSKNGDKLYMEDVDFSTEAHYYKGAPGSYVSHVWTDELDQIELVYKRDSVERDVREKLRIPFYSSGSAIQYEHSMGMSQLPGHILRSVG